MSSIRVTTHNDYSDTITAVEQVRDCVEGSPTIKRETYKYLPHPSSVNTTSPAALKRYKKLIMDAEFDNDTDDTRRELIGKMRLDDITLELPQKLDYLEHDCDGDGTTLKGLAEELVSDVLQVKFKALVSDFNGLSSTDAQNVSIADAQLLDLRANIKQYSRENIVNWNFTRINGAMKLSFIMLLERSYQFNSETFASDEVQNYLILALDENGHYYQQKMVFSDQGQGQLSERDYVSGNSKPLTFLPVSIVADESLPVGKLPKALGYLFNISDKVLYRYRATAVYKECQNALLPTTYTKGWKKGDFEDFEVINKRSNIESGPYAVNGLPRDVDVKTESTQSDMDDFHWYIEQSKKQVSEMGGKSGAEASNMTAQEANMIASAQNAFLDTIATNIERGVKRAIAYCAMFEGLVSADDIHEYDITFDLPRDFATPKMDNEEVNTLIALKNNGLRTTNQVIRQLADGGRDIQDAEQTILELESDGGTISLQDNE